MNSISFEYHPANVAVFGGINLFSSRWFTRGGMIPVNSSNLAAVGYSLGLLTIEFHSGGVYQYFQVPPEIYFGLMRAESHGKFFHARIKKNYSWRRIR